MDLKDKLHDRIIKINPMIDYKDKLQYRIIKINTRIGLSPGED